METFSSAYAEVGSNYGKWEGSDRGENSGAQKRESAQTELGDSCRKWWGIEMLADFGLGAGAGSAGKKP